MVGLIRWEEGLKRPELEEAAVLGGRFLLLRLPTRSKGPLALRRLSRAAERLREAGARRAVFPPQFPHAALFAHKGVYPVETLLLRRALAPAVVRGRLDALGLPPTSAVVALSGEALNGEAQQAVRTLALGYRYVLADFSTGGEALAKSLRRQYGVSLLLHPGADQLSRADALLLYAPRRDLAGENPVFYTLYPGGEAPLPLPLPPSLAAQAPEGCDREQLAAALHGMGLLPQKALLREILR